MAYALGPIRPDERHSRIFHRRHPRRFVIIALAAFAVIGAAGGIVAAHRAITHIATPADVPLIRADAEPTRKRPDDPGGMQVPGQGTLVLDGGHGESKVEQLLPPPETPLPRPAPVEPLVASPPSAPPPPPAAAVPVLIAPPAVPAAPPAAAAAPPASVKPAPVVAAAPAVAATPALKGYRLQLGAVRTPAAAKDEFERLKRLHGDVLGKLGYSAARVDLGERGIFYRIQAGPLADAAVAERDCSALNRRGVRCLLVRP
jgi:cell division septation protein DedD